MQDLHTSIATATERNVKLLHLAGLDSRKCGFLFNTNDAATASAEADIHALTDLIGGAAGQQGPIECVVLNACSTAEMDQLLRAAGMSPVVGWRRTPVHDETAREFCHLFYQALVEQTRGGSPSHRNYRDAFVAATDDMRVHAFYGGAARLPTGAAGGDVGLRAGTEGDCAAGTTELDDPRLQSEHSYIDMHASAASLREHGCAAQQTRAKVFPWQLEDVIQLLSKDGDSEMIYLWRERALRRSEAVPVFAGEQKMSGIPRKRKFVFFLCRIVTNIEQSARVRSLGISGKFGMATTFTTSPTRGPRLDTSRTSSKACRHAMKTCLCTSPDMAKKSLAAFTGTGSPVLETKKCRSKASTWRT